MGIATHLRPDSLKTAAPGSIVRDDVVTGLHLRVSATKRSWFLHYRANGVERRPKLGDFPTLGLADARKAARDVLIAVASGRDPSAERQAERVAPTMEDLWDAWRADRGLAKKTAAEDERIWNKNLSRFHSRKVQSITYEEVVELHKSIQAPYMANRVVILLKTLLDYATKPLRWIASNPVAGIEWNKENKRRRYMNEAEAAAIAAELTKRESTHPHQVLFIYLLIYTGARKSEIAKAKWSQIIGSTIRLTEHKTDGHGHERIIHLPAQAVEILNGLPKNGERILPGVDIDKFWQAVRTAAKCPDLRIHDLRHSFASVAIGAGLTLAQIGELLGHRSANTTQRYAHLMESAGTSLATVTADKLEAMLQH